MAADASVMLDTLLELQSRDTAIDRLRHRRDTIPERAALDAARVELETVQKQLADATERRDEVAREERRFDDEARSLEEKAAEVERTMYSGEVTSPRELQLLQADVDQLRRHRRSLEDRELEVMERREALDTEVTQLEARARELEADAARMEGVLSAAEAEIDEELSGELAARDELAAAIDAALLDDYERRRERARGIGVARLNGTTCQGCHLSIPSVEAERIRKSPPGTVAHCDNCGCILVP
ncbi:MAG TPA: C4-type zinc ribbon domain-containing protein [Acidimicrobiia bacterium]|nr:C4-type zinc ribbon domain-containing protein [Acidimicrobiia bacterium]